MASSFEPIRNRRTRILLACGSPELTQTARDALKAAGFRRVLSVSTGDEAIKELSQGGVEVLVTMVDLPDINAWRLTRLIRSGEFSPRSVPVVVVHEGHATKILETMANDEGIAITSLDDPGQLTSAISCAVRNNNKPPLLCIEDDRRAAEVLRDGLQSAFDVEIAYDGETGVAAWQARRHRLIVLDYKLPGISGGEALQQNLSDKSISADRHAHSPTCPLVDVTIWCLQALQNSSPNLTRWNNFGGSVNACCDTRSWWRWTRKFRKKEETLHEFANRLYAADRFLGMGKVGGAASHVKEALRGRHHLPPTEDAWKKLVREFDR